jgi:hypothetical protein
MSESGDNRAAAAAELARAPLVEEEEHQTDKVVQVLAVQEMEGMRELALDEGHSKSRTALRKRRTQLLREGQGLMTDFHLALGCLSYSPRLQGVS